MLGIDEDGWSGFTQELEMKIFRSEDDKDEKFYIYGDYLEFFNEIPALKGLRFLNRLFRGGTPFIIIANVNLEGIDSFRMCRDIYLPNLELWQELFETAVTEDPIFLLNEMANVSLPLNLDTFDPSVLKEWHDQYNLYLFVYEAEDS